MIGMELHRSNESSFFLLEKSLDKILKVRDFNPFRKRQAFIGVERDNPYFRVYVDKAELIENVDLIDLKATLRRRPIMNSKTVTTNRLLSSYVTRDVGFSPIKLMGWGDIEFYRTNLVLDTILNQ